MDWQAQRRPRITRLRAWRRIVCIALLAAVLPSCGDPQPASGERDTRDADARPEHADVGPTKIRFVDVTKEAGMTAINHSGRAGSKEYLIEAVGPGSAWLDYNHDGFMDLFIPDGDVFSNYRFQQITEERDGTKRDRVICVRREDAKESYRAQLWRNNGDGTFTDVAATAGVDSPAWSFGTTAFDYNADGWTDLFVANWGHDQLYRNNQDGTFTEVAAEVGVQGDEGAWSTCAAVGDIDGDGRLDLYVARYSDPSAEVDRLRRKNKMSLDVPVNTVPGRDTFWRGMRVYIGPVGLLPQADIAYQQQADGTFRDVTKAWGLVPLESHQYGFTTALFDYNGDGLTDLYVANDSVENFLWEQARDSKDRVVFEDRASVLGVKTKSGTAGQASMGLTCSDINQDGEVDYFVTNFSHDYNNIFLGNRMSSGNYYFKDRGRRVMAQQVYYDLSWGCGWEDFDNDGDWDLYVANGHVYYEVENFKDIGSEYEQYNALFECIDAESLSYREIGPKAQAKPAGLDPKDLDAGDGMAVKRCSRQAAFADFNNDGRMDVVVSNLNAAPTVLAGAGPSDENHGWVKLTLEMPDSGNRDALGAFVQVETDVSVQYRPVVALTSFLGTNDPRLHFGVGAAKTCTIRVRWPGQRKFETELNNIAIGKHYRVIRGKKDPVEVPMKSFEVTPSK